MIVEASELGTRPRTFTKARAFAPQAMHAMAKYLSTQEFAGKAHLVLDWSNELGQLPDDAIKPILFVQVVRDVPGVGQLRVEQKYDVDDIFGRDSMTPTILVDLLHELKVTVEKAIAQKET